MAAFFSTLNNAGTPYETSLERFLGDRFHSLANPHAILEGSLSSRDHPSLHRTCGVFKHEITLEPGQSVRFAVALAAGSTQDYYLNDKQQLRALLSGLCDEAARQAMLDQVTAWWRDQLGRLTIHSPEKKLDNAFRWLQYQCQIVYVLNRMKSRFHTGYEYGWGFRDILQDVVFNLPYDPRRSRPCSGISQPRCSRTAWPTIISSSTSPGTRISRPRMIRCVPGGSDQLLPGNGRLRLPG